MSKNTKVTCSIFKITKEEHDEILSMKKHGSPTNELPAKIGLLYGFDTVPNVNDIVLGKDEDGNYYVASYDKLVKGEVFKVMKM